MEGAIKGACQGYPESQHIFHIPVFLWGAVWSYLNFPNHPIIEKETGKHGEHQDQGETDWTGRGCIGQFCERKRFSITTLRSETWPENPQTKNEGFELGRSSSEMGDTIHWQRVEERGERTTTSLRPNPGHHWFIREIIPFMASVQLSEIL